ncbi:hypothetical protein A1Q1_03619 [Trichosporon asahii var. asahii CBS 2479]|uniref:Elongation factor 1-gamma n=1 Tax=Trichosporon asahii var. asahii (strain ATCC 90039 / CBS 2479 / JCM 2466 / KCTC 7840 / NBRC 103889/ NCYC 2677 / UAMH 7654) TaxID=1186058 RepID=J6EXH4_TRIAS|nr:hypothetical protein A1Q1_03619 [Trichosporon asahii var. asahii CBS 2479]EJT47507.1 hypothetical protein A1Q1_03619 [Trichosporon asahii var. asahii CBS 2479]
MAPVGKLYGAAGNPRFRRTYATAKAAGVEVEVVPCVMDGSWKTEEFLKKFPLGYLPAFEGKDGFKLQESGAIADYLGGLNPESGIVPTDAEKLADVRQWQYFADQELFVKSAPAFYMLIGRIPYSKPAFDAIIAAVTQRLEVLNAELLRKTFIVGERLTIADIFLASALLFIFSTTIDATIRAKVPNVVRYFNTIINHPKIADVFAEPAVELLQEPAVFKGQSKKKEEKKEKAPKAEKPKAEKAPKAKKEAEEDLAPPPDVPAEPKAKNPLDSLPKSNFNLEEFKRQYSNLDTRGAGGSLEWFYNNFDKEGFSVWRIDFLYNEDLTMTFMSANQIGGLFARWEASRKYLFGSVGVLGKTNDSIITGVLVLRGQDADPVVSVAPDWESYKFTRMDLDKPEDKEFFEGAMAWDLKVGDKEWADGKNFK